MIWIRRKSTRTYLRRTAGTSSGRVSTEIVDDGLGGAGSPEMLTGAAAITGAAGGRPSAVCFSTNSTGARNRYPRRAKVSMNRGLAAESLKASRNLLITVLRL